MRSLPSVNKRFGLKRPVRRTKAIDLGVDAIRSIGGAIGRMETAGRFQYSPFRPRAGSSHRRADGEVPGTLNCASEEMAMLTTGTSARATENFREMLRIEVWTRLSFSSLTNDTPAISENHHASVFEACGARDKHEGGIMATKIFQLG